MGVMNGILTNVASIKDSLSDIKAAANNKGADIQDNDYLDAWADKIDAIPTQYTPHMLTKGDTTPKAITLVDSLVLPTQDQDGVNVNPNLSQVPGTVWDEIRMAAKTVVIPNHFNNVSLPYNSGLGYGALERLDINTAANSTVRPTGIYSWPSLKQINVQNATTVYFGPGPGSNYTYEKLEVNLPEATDIRVESGSSSQSAYTREIQLNAPKATTMTFLYSSSYTTNRTFENLYGEVFLPNLTTITASGSGSSPSFRVFNYYNAANYDGNVLTWRLPKLTTMSGLYYFFSTSGSAYGKTKICIGPNLSSVYMDGFVPGNNNTKECHIPNDTSSATYAKLIDLGWEVGTNLFLDYGEPDGLYPEDAQYFNA